MANIYIPDLYEIESSIEEEISTGVTAKPILTPKIEEENVETVFEKENVHLELLNNENDILEFTEYYNPEMVEYLLQLGPDNIGNLIYDPKEPYVDGRKVETRYAYVRKMYNLLKKAKKNNYSVPQFYNYGKNENNGRIFCTGGGFQGMQKKLRGALINSNEYDVDQINAHPTILMYINKKECPEIECKRLEAYIENREIILRDNGFSKKDVLMFMNMDDPRPKKNGIDSSFLFDLLKEFRLIKDFIFEKYKDVIKTKNKTNKKSSTLNRLICIYENKILQSSIKLCKSKNIKVTTPIFDGMHVQLGHPTDSELEDFIEMLNLNSKEYGVKWSIKPFTKCIVINNELIQEVEHQGDSYDDVKLRFEKDYFIVESPLTFIKQYQNELLQYKKSDFASLVAPFSYMGLSKKHPFFNEWLADENRRSYRKMEFLPPPVECPKDVFNLFTGFEYHRWDDVEYTDDTDISVFLNHLRILAGRDKTEEVYQYLINYLAHLIQKPGELPMVAIAIKSLPGIGKNSFFEPFVENILGPKFLLSTAQAGNVTGDYADLNEKLVVIMDEAGKDAFETKDAMKALITNNNIMNGGKYEQKKNIKNFSRFLFFTNNHIPVVIEQNGRRVQCIEIIDKPQLKPYFENLAKAFTDKSRLLKFVDFLKARDLSEWSATNRIKTNYYEQLESITIPIPAKFIDYILSNEEKDIIKMSASTLYEKYKRFIDNNYSSKIKKMSPNAMGRYIREFDGISYVRSNGSKYFLEKAVVWKYMLENSLIDRDFPDNLSIDEKIQCLLEDNGCWIQITEDDI